MQPKFLISAVLVAMLAPAVASAQSKGCPAPQPMSNMKMTFDSEFAKDGTLSPQQWRPYIGQHGPLDQEAEVYVPEAISVVPKQGLQLEIAQKNYWEHHYTAGWIGTQGLFSQTYGHFEVLAKMPQANGIWPAFWMVPENSKWPPEIDVVEYVFAPHGKHPDPNVKDGGSVPETTLHWADANLQHKFMHAGWGSDQPRTYVYDWDKTAALPGLDKAYAGYHLYSIDWRPGLLEWQLDGKPVFCMTDDSTTGDRVPHTPMFMIISESVAPEVQAKPHWAGILDPGQKFPLEYYVAYARAYQFKDIHDEPQLALDLRNVTVSNPTPAPGDTITIEGTLQVGSSDLGKGRLEVSLYSFLDVHQFYGIGPRVGSAVDVDVPHLAAGQSYRVKANFTLPHDLAPGYYGIDTKANYTEGPGNDVPGQWPRGIHYRQAATISVR